MNGEEEPGSSLIANIVRGVVIAAAFVAVSALFAMLLRPLAEPRSRRDTIAIRTAVSPVSGEHAAVRTNTAAPASAPPVAPVAAPVQINGPKIAILVTELGADATAGATAIEKLPAAFGIAFVPGAAATRSLAKIARVDGHEVWIGLPMQPKAWPKVSPGPKTLLVADPPAANAKRVEWALSQVERPVGAYTMMGSAFTIDASAMAPVAAAIKRHGLVFLDARSISGTVAAKTVAAAGGRALSNDLFIDADPRPDAISAALERLAKQARSRGQAIGIARALPVTIELLPAWAASLDASGMALVPPSSLAP